MAQPKYTLYKYVRLGGKWRYCRAALYRNHTVKSNVVLIGKKEETHSEGSYYLYYAGQWIPVGPNALQAQREQQRRLLLGIATVQDATGKSTLVHIDLPVTNGRKKLKDEIEAYLANLELAQRVCTTVNDKRRFLTAFLQIVGKEYVDEVDRNTVLTFRNKLFEQGYAPKSVDTMMMCIVTFFNRWVKRKLSIEAGDWPEYGENDPEPYTDEEIRTIEKRTIEKKRTSGKLNLLARLFRSAGCRDKEIAHLFDIDLNVRTKEIMIRAKPCTDCKKCRSRGGWWKPKTKAGTRNIPVSDSLFVELLALGKGLLFPNEDGKIDGHLLRKLQKAVKGSGVPKVKLHRFRDTFITNKLRDGIDIVTVSKWAGHDDINVTRSYAAWLDSQGKAARDAANREDTRYRRTKETEEPATSKLVVAKAAKVIPCDTGVVAVTGIPSL